MSSLDSWMQSRQNFIIFIALVLDIPQLFGYKAHRFFQEIPNFYLKITAKVWVRLIGEYFPETIFFDHSYWYDFKQIKGHTHIDFYEMLTF